jgi:hypothetical protein
MLRRVALVRILQEAHGVISQETALFSVLLVFNMCYSRAWTWVVTNIRTSSILKGQGFSLKLGTKQHTRIQVQTGQKKFRGS